MMLTDLDFWFLGFSYEQRAFILNLIKDESCPLVTLNDVRENMDMVRKMPDWPETITNSPV